MTTNIPKTEREIEFAGKKITLCELTVAQVRKVLEDLENLEESNTFDELLDSLVPASVIIKSSGLSMEELEKHSPSELLLLAEEVGVTNSFFLKMIERKVQAFELIKQNLGETKEILPVSSTETPAS